MKTYYELHLTIGNGYQCSCCRDEHKSIREFKTYDELIEDMAERFLYKTDVYNNNQEDCDGEWWDFEVDHIYCIEESDAETKTSRDITKDTLDDPMFCKRRDAIEDEFKKKIEERDLIRQEEERDKEKTQLELQVEKDVV